MSAQVFQQAPREHKRHGMTNEQLYFAVALPLLGNAFAVGVLMWLLNRSFTSMKQTWRAELYRFESVISARLKQLDGKV
jgi:hypothetical protein